VSVGQIIVEEEEKEISFRWDDIEAIEFLDTPKAVRSRFGERLYGTVLTEEGGGFTGFICWDLDEMFTTQELDGESEEKDTEVAFGEIASIEKKDSSSALVTLKTGDVLTLTGTNDVNADNRGILVLDPMLGQVRLSWSEFAKLVLKEAPEDLKDQFDGGAPLKGTVETVSGDTYHGMIRWDNDEEFGWELLDGNYSDLEFDVEIGLVRSIEKKSHDSSVVSLLDGRSFELQGSNDVDGGNKGIFILLENGEETVVRWQHFSRVDFDRPDPG
jgi:hypothetical protein